MKFLLVDDNEITLDVEKLMLETYGLTVDCATCGKQAVELAEKEEYSLIFMDIQMPVMDGYEASAKIREFNTFVPIIALSADKISKTDVCYIESGMNDSVRKPLQLSDVEEILNKFSAVPKSGKKTSKSRNKDAIFDYNELILMLGDKKAIYQALQQFLALHGNDCDLLKKNIKEKNFIQARKIIHNIVGISGILLCRRLYKISIELNEDLRQEKTDHLESFLSIWTQTVRELSERCVILTEELTYTKATVDWETLREDFKSLCKDFDINATTLFMENIKIFEKNLIPKEFSKLKKFIQTYDFLTIIDNMEEYNV